jgi:hypothetical protein
VSADYTWEAEYRGWYVFAQPDHRGEPFFWKTAILVKKGTCVVGFFAHIW